MIGSNHKYILISYKFTTNFKVLNYQTQIKKIKLNFMRNFVLSRSAKKTQKQFCKSMFVFICYIQFFRNNLSNVLEPKSVFFTSLAILPKTHKTVTLLKSSFVNKISKKNYTLERYSFVLNFFIDNKVNLKLNNLGCKFIINSLTSFFSSFESNICFSHRVKISLPLTKI